MSSSLRIIIGILLLFLYPIISQATIVTVYVYNTEFSINPPGNPIEPAIIIQGDTILWQWVQGGHTTTAVAGSSEQWDELIDSANPTFMYQFDNVGVFWYYCIPHGTDNGNGTASGMASTITVLAAGSGACCLPMGDCITTDEGACLAQGGSFSGVGTNCDTTTCYVSLELTAIKDNILYESVSGDISNGAGVQLYTGNGNSGARRSVVAFDLTGIPADVEMLDAQLKLYCNSSKGSAFPVTAQKLLADWGEGTSDANGQEGSGAPATTGDATWFHTFYDTEFWTAVGGDFSSTISATTSVDAANTDYTWSTTQLTDDVSSWLANPLTNFGWIMRGDETTTDNTKRFASAQTNTVSERPRLILNYQVSPQGACCFSDGSCSELTENQCIAQSGIYQGHGTDCVSTLCGIQLTKFIDPLPLPAVAIPVTGTAGGSAHYRMTIDEVFQTLHSELPPTRVWGYNGSYPGPTIEAYRDSLVTTQWVNNLRVFETGALRTTHALAVDTCLHGPNMTGSVPVTVTHLHGGKVPQGSDGYPEDTFVPGDSSEVYTYPNIQPAGTLWYHDHALGITRLNVMMGLAGVYLLRDANEDTLGLPSGEYEVPLVIQDKSFRADGSIIYPEDFQDHFFGDMLLVNGKVWPYFNVKQGKYRFRLLNGSNSRVYTLNFSNGATMTQIAGELGLLETPVTFDTLTMLPGERYDVVVDFSGYAAGTEIILMNSAPAPFPGFPGVGVIPDVMKFIVQGEIGFTSGIPDTLAVVEELLPANADEERLFELITIAGPLCEGETEQIWTINGLHWDTITEQPIYGATEIWTWHNQSGISHPMHMHLISFQILDRQAIDNATGLPVGPLLPPEVHEQGWKDTAHSPPGYRTRVITRFGGFTGLFSYHCHILEHEDHEMMRQFEVRPCTIVTETVDEKAGSLRFALDCAQPGDTVFFSQELVGDTIKLQDTLSISKDVTLLNTNAGEIVIMAPGVSQLVTVELAASVHMKNLTFISGNGTTGRAFVNLGSLTLEQIIIYDQVSNPSPGSLILNQGLLTVKDNVQLLKTN